jgi:hypothetical protein
MSRGSIKVSVSARKVPVSTISYQRPIYTVNGVLVAMANDRVLVKSVVLDDSSRRVVDEARNLSRNLGVTLEVLQEGDGPLRKLASFLSGRSQTPSHRLPASSLDQCSS